MSALHPTRSTSFRATSSLSLLLLLTGLLLNACAEQEKVYSLGVGLSAGPLAARLDGLKDGLKAFGYVEGKNVKFYTLNLDGLNDEQQLAALKDYANRNYDAYWSSTNGLALKQAGLKRPIIGAGIVDPVVSGIAESVARPGSNISGVDSFNTELTAKRLAWLLKLDPTIRKVYLTYVSNNSGQVAYLDKLRPEAMRLGITLLEKPYTTSEELAAMLPKFTAAEAPALLTIGIGPFVTPVVVTQLNKLVEREKVLIIGAERSNFQAGVLLSYGSSSFSLGRQTAVYVDKVLRGSNPATMPIMQPDKIDLFLNQKLADKLGRKFPDVLLAAAEDIEK